MTLHKLEGISRLLDNLLQAQKIDKDLAHLLVEYIKTTDADSIRLDKVINQIAHLTNETKYLSVAIQGLEAELSSLGKN